MGSYTDKANKLTNGAILVIITFLKCTMPLAEEAETGTVFLNDKEGTVLHTTLEELGHPQPPTTLQTNNTTATGYSNRTIKQKLTWVMDVRFYWVKERVKQGQSHVYWGPGYQNFVRLLYETPFASASLKNVRNIHSRK
jgi:hypothetical protein